MFRFVDCFFGRILSFVFEEADTKSLSLEQVLEINQKVFAASLIRPQEQENAEALQREESTLKEIPQRIVDEAFGSVMSC